jgi:5-hydroxyisourate hydrolase
MISTHVLDTSKGRPAAGIPLRLLKLDGGHWSEVESGATNPDGRHSFFSVLTAGVYQIIFDVENYLSASGNGFFYSQVPVIFKVENPKSKYHVPLLLNPFGYSTYRGS